MLKRLVNATIRFLLFFFVKIDKSELNRIPSHGPLLLVANHINFLDAPALITHLEPRPLAAFVKKETWDNPFLGFLFNVWGGIPIDRGTADFAAFKAAKDAIKDGKIFAVTPEGTRSESGLLQRGKSGIAILADKCKAPILPIAFYGQEEFKTNIKKLKRTKMTVKVGYPFMVYLNGDIIDKETMQEMADAIMLEIAELMPEKYYGVYRDITVDKEKYIKYLDRASWEHVPETFREQFSQA